MPSNRPDPVHVLGIIGSPHKHGMTARLAQSALRGARDAGAETSLLYLADEDLKPCRACGGRCFDTQVCVQDEVATTRHAQLQHADGLVMCVPVYCWQLNGLTSLFIDKMRWDTGSVLRPRNRRAALGIACAGGSGTGCVLALQALYRYFYNWAFHGISPIPVTRFNFDVALEEAAQGGARLVARLREGVEPFGSLGEAMLDYESLPYMGYTPVDELALIVRQQLTALEGYEHALAHTLREEATHASDALARGERAVAAQHLAAAYEAGRAAWQESSDLR